MKREALSTRREELCLSLPLRCVKMDYDLHPLLWPLAYSPYERGHVRCYTCTKADLMDWLSVYIMLIWFRLGGYCTSIFSFRTRAKTWSVLLNSEYSAHRTVPGIHSTNTCCKTQKIHRRLCDGSELRMAERATEIGKFLSLRYALRLGLAPFGIR